MASENEETPRPLRRSVARHARPRLTVRRRMQLPVGRAIAITAMPTALLMGTLAPKLAFADTKAPQATTVADTTPTGDTCTKGTNSPSPTPSSATAAPAALVKAAKIPQQQASSASSAASTAASAAASATKSTKALAPVSAAPGASATQTPTATATPSPSASASASASSSTKATNPITGLLDGLGGLLGITHADTTSGSGTVRTADSTPSATDSASPNDSATPTDTPTPSATPTASDSASASASPSPSGSATAAPSDSPSPSPSSTDLTQPCDISTMAAPLDTTNSSAIFPADSWTLHASTLKLTNSVFHGVVTVHTQGGDKRVLKFTATAIDIGDLDMSTNQRDQKLHVQGAKGSTSTMRNGTVTMYVEKLSGKLEAAEGLPVGILNVNLTLTPDTLPQWLYNLVGAIPIPLNMTLSGVEVIQAGQIGGDLTIPGMHLYYTAS